MPGKSKHGKGKRPQNRNRVRPPVSPAAASATGNSTTAPAAVAPAAAVNTASAPARAPKVTGAKVSVKNMVYAGATREQYPFFTSELKVIGILTAIILVVLVVLGLVIK
jgi:hypothetical protein